MDGDTQNLRKLLLELGVKELTTAEFYSSHVFPKLASMPAALRDEAMVAMIKSRDPSVEALLVDLAFLPARKHAQGAQVGASITLYRPRDLFDPTAPDVQDLVDEDQFPAAVYTQPEVLSVLRSLGLRHTLHQDSVLQCARHIEQAAAALVPNGAAAGGLHSPEMELALTNITNRAQKLLKFLSFKIVSLTNEPKLSTTPGPAGSTGPAGAVAGVDKLKKIAPDPESKSAAPPPASAAVEPAAPLSFVEQLACISWLPVLRRSPNAALPWQASFEFSPVAPPAITRTRQDLHMCSYTMRIVDGDVSSELERALNWKIAEQDTIPVEALATQLQQYGAMHCRLRQAAELNSSQAKSSGLIALTRMMDAHVARLYELLQRHVADAGERIVAILDEQCPSLWNGEIFLAPWQLSFDIDEKEASRDVALGDATPYLRKVSSAFETKLTKQFKPLCELLKVRRGFSIADYSHALDKIAEDQKVCIFNIIARLTKLPLMFCLSSQSGLLSRSSGSRMPTPSAPVLHPASDSTPQNAPAPSPEPASGSATGATDAAASAPASPARAREPYPPLTAPQIDMCNRILLRKGLVHLVL